MLQAVQVHHEDGITTITLDRADKKNALTNTMYGIIADTISQAEQDKQTRMIVIQSTGDTFTAGNDISEFASQSAKTVGLERHVTRFLQQLATTTVPIMAAVQGKAVGIGTTLLLHCDYVLLAEDAQLITPFVNLALVPEAASSLLMPARIGHVRAFELFSLGEPLNAHQALEWGLANKIVPTNTLHAEAKKMATRFASKPLGSLRATKKLMRNHTEIQHQLAIESTIFSERLIGAEAKEAFAAFAEKRAPNFAAINS